MEKATQSDTEKVAILPSKLLQGVVAQLQEAREQISCFAGSELDKETQTVLSDIDTMLTKIQIRTVITLDPWEALTMAELALADLEASERKGYLTQAKKMVFAAMEAKRNTV